MLCWISSRRHIWLAVVLLLVVLCRADMLRIVLLHIILLGISPISTRDGRSRWSYMAHAPIDLQTHAR